jgi:cob(I)alamin adenosyltransferase
LKIYTRTGDDGTTGLFGGARVAKSHPRIETYGTVDELNAVVGIALTLDPPARLRAVLLRTQHDLFVLGADLATPAGAKPYVPRIAADHVDALEADIDAFEADLPPLRHFILPGGAPHAAQLHVARTVCRRAERLVVEAAAHEPFNEHALVYLNRLSDLLFVAARWANHSAAVADVEWLPEKPVRADG